MAGVNETLELLLAIGLPALAVVGTATGVLVRRRGRGAPDAQPPTAATQAPTRPATRTTDDTEPDVVAGAPAGVDVLERAAPPVLDVPEPVLGRLARLRGRLARSGSPLGARLLAVLSRDHLTE